MGTCVTWGEEADQIQWLLSRVKTAVHGEQGNLTCQVAFLHSLPRCSASGFVVPNSIDNLPSDVKVYARERHLMFLSCTVWV